LRGRERGVYRGGIFWIVRGSIVAILLLRLIWMRREFYITILTQYLYDMYMIGYRITSSSWRIPGALLEFGLSHVRGGAAHSELCHPSLE
jgi:hypothetical protein